MPLKVYFHTYQKFSYLDKKTRGFFAAHGEFWNPDFSKLLIGKRRGVLTLVPKFGALGLFELSLLASDASLTGLVRFAPPPWNSRRFFP